jgi:ABC transporter substrate binding protein
VLASQGTQVVELAVKSRLPAIYWRSDIVQAGGLMSYGVSITDQDRRAATYVDKILKGAKPADLPVEQPTKFELVINLKAAQANRPHDSRIGAFPGGQGDQGCVGRSRRKVANERVVQGKT